MGEPIRVLQIVTYMGRGGLETMLMNYYRHIDRSKVQFDFLVHRDFEGDYDREILSLGGKIYYMPRLIPWSHRYRQKLCAFFGAHPEYQIIHVHQDCLSSVALQCAKKCGVPVRIAHSHSSSAIKNIKYPIKQYYMKKIPKYAADLFACGKRAGDWMFSGHVYQVIPNAIDAGRFAFDLSRRKEMRDALGLRDEQLVIGNVSRFSEQKNHLFLIDVFEAIQKKAPNAVLLLVGDGERRAQIEAYIAEKNLQDHVILTGVQSNVWDYYQAMDVFVFPSYYEGLGIAVVEAQASGLPCCVSTAIPDEAVLTELVERRSLHEGAKSWAMWILGCCKKQRENTTEKICAAGYDIAQTAVWLENFYQNVVNRNEQ